MIKPVLLLAFATVAAATLDIEVNHPDVINRINSIEGLTWTAGANARFEGHTLADVAKLCGTVVEPEKAYKLPARESYANTDLPTDFDARTNWSNCPLIGKARDQSACGSCWAFGSTEAFNDRMCIASKGQFQTELSAQDTASCCNGFACGMSAGCNGGQPGAAWNWFTSKGVVSGGGYPDIGKTDTCWPYQLPICSHHVASPDIKNCTETEYPTPSCRSDCSNTGYATPFAQDKHMAKSAYSIESVTDIQNEIMQYGPVTAAFSVYADFPTYKSGVYKQASGQYLGGHAIKIVGWGVENGQDYWTVMNSWNQEWGMQGAFKILRGVDECGIESQVSAGQV